MKHNYLTFFHEAGAGSGDGTGGSDPKPTPNPDNDTPPGDDTEEPKDPADEPEPAFWDQVSQRYGESSPLVIPDMDPEELLTPGGVHAVLVATEQRIREMVEKEMAEADPRAYAYRLHRMSKRPDEEFFSRQSYVLPELSELEGNVDLQVEFYTRVLKAKGLDQDEISAALNVKKEKLFDKVQKEHARIMQQEAQERDNLLQRQKEQEALREKAAREVTSTIQSTIADNALQNIMIPTADIPAFTKFVQNNLWELPNGKFGFVQEIDAKGLNEMLEGLYFQFAKSDLRKVVAKAKAKTADGLRLGIKKENQQQQQQQKPDPKKSPSLGDVWNSRITK